MHTPLSITIKELSFTYNANTDRYVFQNLNLKVSEGEILLIQGASGTGKTTLLKLMAGLNIINTQMSGSIIYEVDSSHYDLIKDSKSFIRLVRNKYVNLIFQNSISAFFNEMSIFNQLKTGFANRLGAENENFYTAFADYLTEFGFSPQDIILDRLPTELSGGQLQRIDIAYALFTNSKFLFLDEPLTGLDKRNYLNIIEKLKQFSRQGGMIIIASHDQKIPDLLEVKIVRLDEEPLPTHGRTNAIPLEFLKSLESREHLNVKALISKTYKNTGISSQKTVFPTLNKVEFVLDKTNTFLAIVGESGSGKTTLLKILAGILKPDKGSVLEFSNPKKKIEIIFQASPQSLNPAYKIGTLLSTSRENHNSSTKELLGYFQLSEDLLDRKAGELSGGQIQRFCFIKAILNEPDLLLLDEPLVGLDEMNKSIIIKCLQILKKQSKMKIIFVTHSLDEIDHLYDAVLSLDNL